MRKRSEEGGSPRVKEKILLIFYTAAGLGTAITAAAAVFNAYFAQRPWMLALSFAGFAVAMLLLTLYFKRKVYDPIKKIERAMEVVSDAENILDFEIEISRDSELYELSSYLNKTINQLKAFADREYSATLLAKQAEINALQMQINPHFLYNTLDSIRGLALTEGMDDIADMTKALSKLFRYSISKEDDFSTLQEEIGNVMNYMTIQHMRFNNKFQFQTDIDTEEDPDILAYQIPKLTLQPIVENSVFYGLETKPGPGRIVLHAYTTERRLIVSVEDDGVGMSQARLDEIAENLMKESADPLGQSASIGLVNVNERIRLLFGEDYGLRVTSTVNVGTTVEITLPLVRSDS
ncbi:MAG: sensor histidine kinase [Clostridiales Family XIII bacterium]|jgi:two-component system sensor histidine kinase YesM|nr:sensor histidine kinase [Clostridiales Family XIII bacterium]